MNITADHYLSHMVDGVFLDGKKVEAPHAADDTEGWVDVFRADWRWVRPVPDPEWDGRTVGDVPIQRLYGEVHIELGFTDAAGVKHRLTAWEPVEESGSCPAATT